MLPGGVYPALVTPFDPEGSINYPNLHRLVAWHESQGSKGVVLAGTNGEGASLTNVERRDLAREGRSACGTLMKLILGTPVCSFEDFRWLSSQAGKIGVDALLVSPPFFLKRATEEGIAAWLRAALDVSPVPVLLYHNPPVFGASLPFNHLEELCAHPMCAGIKNSDVVPELFPFFRQLLSENQALLVGDETLLGHALDSGATGSISGAANLVPHWLSRIIFEWPGDSAKVRLALLMPLLEAIRSSPQPETNKDVLHRIGLLDSPTPRLPLLPGRGVELADLMESIVGTAK